MKHRIENIKAKKLVGKSSPMSLIKNSTTALWKNFMQEKNLITNNVSNDLISMQVYNKDLNFKNFTPSTVFEKWATTEVHDFSQTPSSMNEFILEGGLYVIFTYKGLTSDFPKTAKYIFEEWLPSSDYELDQRPHFEVLGKKYKNNDINSEEEIYIPVKKKL